MPGKAGSCSRLGDGCNRSVAQRLPEPRTVCVTSGKPCDQARPALLLPFVPVRQGRATLIRG